MSNPICIKITADNWFNTGWVYGILGLEKAEFFDAENPILDSDIDAYDDGFQMGVETPCDFRETFKKMISLGQIHIN